MLKGCSQLDSLSLAFDISRFDDPNFAAVWSHAPQTLTSLSIGYIPKPMLTQLLDIPPSFFPSLRKLQLSLDIITDSTLRKISAALPSLTHLDLKDSPHTKPSLFYDLTNAGLQSLNPLKRISLVRTQEFLFTRVNDQGIRLMAQNCFSLQSVTLGGFCGVTDAGFRELAHNCPDLHTLEIFQSSQATACSPMTSTRPTFSRAPSSRHALPRHRHARYLPGFFDMLDIFQGSQITDMLFHNLRHTPLALTHVTLRRCNLLTDVGIESLALNKDLVFLDLRDCTKLSDGSLRYLSALTKLRVLYLDGTDITDAGVSYLGGGDCPLTALSLRGCGNLTNDCVANLFSGGLRATLRSLDLSRIVRLDGGAIDEMVRRRVLIVELRVRECAGIGTRGVIALASMVQMEGGYLGGGLEVLDMYKCSGLTPLAFTWFKKPYFPRLAWLGVSGRVKNRDLVKALNVNRPMLRVRIKGEELRASPALDLNGKKISRLS